MRNRRRSVSASTTKKVSASAFGIATGIVLAWAIHVFGGIDVPGEVGAAIGALCSGLFSLLIPDEREA